MTLKLNFTSFQNCLEHSYENSSEDAYFDGFRNRFLKHELEYHKKKY